MGITTLELNVDANSPVTQSVKSKEIWADNWSNDIPTLFAKNIAWATNPNMPSASLHYRYGTGQLAGSTSMVDYPRTPPVSRGDYIRIELTGHEIDSTDSDSKYKNWHGLVLDINDDDNGVVTITCVGMEFILEHEQITSSIWADDSDADPVNWTNRTINRVISFNEGNVPNMTPVDVQGEPSSVFSGHGIFKHHTDGDSAVKYWSTREIVRYLLFHQLPKDDADLIQVPITIDSDSAGRLPVWDSPQWNPEGQTIKAFLDSFISRSRGLGYYLEVDSSDDLQLRVFTYAPEDVALPITSPANQKILQNDTRYILRADQMIQGSVLTQINSETRYDRVRCVGARSQYVFPLAIKDGTLIERWKSTLKTKYDDGASQDAGYPASAEIEERQRLDQAARSNPRFANVYSRFGLSVEDPDSVDFWDGTVFDGDGGSTFYSAVPDANNSNNPQKLFPTDIRFLSQLPLLSNYDYSGGGTPAVRADLNNVVAEQYMPTLVFFERPDEADKWVDGYNVSAFANLEIKDDESTEFDWVISFQPDQQSASFHLSISGQMPHFLSPEDNSNFKSGHQASVFSPLAYESDYIKSKWSYDKMIVVAAVEGNDYCEATAGTDTILEDFLRTKQIDFGSRYQKHHMTADCPVSIDPETGDLERRTVSGFVRDDTEQLEAIAEFAYAWYSLDRATLRIETGHFGNFKLGAMVASLKPGVVATFSTDTVTLTGSDFAEGDAIVFYLADSAKLPANLSPGTIYFLSGSGDDWNLKKRPNGSNISSFGAGATGTAYATNSGANTPITSIELNLPVNEGEETGFSSTVIETGNSEFDVRAF